MKKRIMDSKHKVTKRTTTKLIRKYRQATKILLYNPSSLHNPLKTLLYKEHEQIFQAGTYVEWNLIFN